MRALALVVYMVMGIIAFFYSLDSLYADRRDRSVLFWKSLPLSDAETVLSKFAVAALVIPLVALVAALLAQLVVAAGGSAKLAMSGMAAGHHVAARGLVRRSPITRAVVHTGLLWYAPIVGLPDARLGLGAQGPVPVGRAAASRAGCSSTWCCIRRHVGDFITGRLFGLYRLLGSREKRIDATLEMDDKTVTATSRRRQGVDLVGSLKEFYSSPDLWLGVVAARLLLAGAMWVRRYRDETCLNQSMTIRRRPA